jgi:hypothetical protein
MFEHVHHHFHFRESPSVDALRWLVGLPPRVGVELGVTSFGQRPIPLERVSMQFTQAISIGDGPARFQFRGLHNGKPVPVDGAFTVSVSDPSLVTVTPDASDGSIFAFQETGTVGSVDVTVSADVRLGPDVATKSVIFTLQIVPSEADSLDVAFLGQGTAAADGTTATAPIAPTNPALPSG